MFVGTLSLGVCVALGCLVVGLPLAVLRGMADLPAGALWDVLFLIPFMVPPYIGAFAWIMTLQPGGFATQALGVDAGRLLFSFWRRRRGDDAASVPGGVFRAVAHARVVGARFADVGRVCGASPLDAFFRITLPLSFPGFTASLLLVFALTVEEYGTPARSAARAILIVLVTGIEERFRRMADRSSRRGGDVAGADGAGAGRVLPAALGRRSAAPTSPSPASTARRQHGARHAGARPRSCCSSRSRFSPSSCRSARCSLTAMSAAPSRAGFA